MVVGSGGRLIPWIPLVDAHGVDRAYTWDGVEAPSFAQIKTSGFADEEGRHRWELRVGSFAPYAQFSVVLALIDPKSNLVGDVFWRLDSTVVRRLARREYDGALRTEVTASWPLPRTTTGSLPTAIGEASYGRNS